MFKAAGRCDPLTQFECIGQEGKCIGILKALLIINYFLKIKI
jgi:hypothetical protein